MTLNRQFGTYGALNLAGFVIVLVGAILAAFLGLTLVPRDGQGARGVFLIGLAALAFLAAFVSWREDAQLAGFFAVVAAVGLLVVRAETEGVLVLIGGVLSLASTRLTTGHA